MTDERKPDADFSKLFHTAVKSRIWAVLNPNAAKVYIVLHKYISDRERICWPSVGTIAKDAGMHVKSVGKATHELVRWGLITKRRRSSKNFYYLNRGSEMTHLLHPSHMDVVGASKSEQIKLPRKKDKKGRFETAGSHDPLPDEKRITDSA